MLIAMPEARASAVRDDRDHEKETKRLSHAFRFAWSASVCLEELHLRAVEMGDHRGLPLIINKSKVHIGNVR